MATITTDLPISSAGSKSKSGSDGLEAEAIGLDVAVRIHGSQVAAVVLESTEHVEPFEEDTSTMIVFPRGAVVKLRARVRTGHAIVLTNIATKQTALCRIIQVNTAPNIAHYVKLEFIQPTPGFWSVHFPSDPLPSARPQEIPAPVSASAPPTAKPGKLAESVAQTNPVPALSPQIMSRLAASVAPVPHTVPPAQAQPVAAKPPVREVTKSTLPREPPLPTPLSQYGSARHGQEENIVSLASSPFSAEQTTANQTKSALPASKAAAKRERRTAAVEPPIFDSLTTQEEVFPREEPATHTDLERFANAGTSRKAISGVDYSSLLQPASTPKRRSSTLLFAAAAVVVLAFVAAGAMYMRRNPAHATQTASAAPASSQAASQPAAVTPSPVETSSVSTPSSAPSQAQPRAAIAEPTPARHANSVALEPTSNSPKSAASAGHPVISTGTADIYAGDLRARPQIARRAAAHVAAPMPDLAAPASRDIPASTGGNALGSLVSGGARSGLVAPAPPKPALVQGGNVQLPRLISSIAPVYPQLATANHVEGDVKIQAQIDASGRVTSTKVISGPILLRAAAMNAVRQWKYSPAMLDGKPIATQYAVTVRFHLNQ